MVSAFVNTFLNRVKNEVLIRTGLHRHLDSDSYIQYARKRGCKIGDGTRFLGTKKLDLGAAPMIEIGENCTITDRVRLVAHTSDAPTLKERYGKENAPTHGSVGPITVGDGVFIGENSIVLPNVTIGDYCIIGAGSVVVDDIPSESVAAGNPCRVIMDLDDYRKRCLEKEEEMMRTYVRRFRERGIECSRDGIEEYVRYETNFESVEEFVDSKQ